MTNEFGVDVPEHTLLSRLGRGGMAAVYLAREERLGRLVAIKVIDERFERDERFRRRFEREARTAASLTHPNIVPVYQYGFTTDLRPYLTMAFLEDGSLRDRLFKFGALPVLEALSITRQIAGALHAAHARNIIHRDLKPDNVLFQQDMALLTDFGIAKVLNAGTALTAAGANPGTVRYFSPEQARERPIDHRSDIYSLGVMLYEMLTGQVPIEGDTVVHLMMHIAQYPPKPLPAALHGLQPLMDLLIAKHPADRLRSCADVISIIQAMERNWTRFGQLDRLAHGVSLRPTETALPERHTLSAAPTQLFATPPPNGAGEDDEAPVDREAFADSEAFAASEPVATSDTLADGEARERSTTHPASRTSATEHGDAAYASAGFRNAGNSSVPDTANGHADALQPLRNENPPRSGIARGVFITLAATVAAIAIYALLAAINANLKAASAHTDQAAASDSAAAERGASATLASTAVDTTVSHGVATISRARSRDGGPTEMSLPETAMSPGQTAVSLPEKAVRRTTAVSSQIAALNVQVRPLDATVTLLGTDTQYQPGMQVPVGSVRIQIASPGHITERRTVLVGPGVNNIAITLDPRGHKRVARNP